MPETQSSGEVDYEVLWRRTLRACKLAASFFALTVVCLILALLFVGNFFAAAGNPKPPDASTFDLVGKIGLYSLPLLMLAATYNIVRALLWSFRGMRSPVKRKHPWTAVFIGGLVVLYFEFHGWFNYLLG